jgi:glutathione S-transferase
VARFRTYDVDVGDGARAYMATMMALPAWQRWVEAGLKETWVVPEDEVDWPKVKRA